MRDTLILIASLPLFAAFWWLIHIVISFLSGWRRLSDHYRAEQPLDGRKWHMCSLSLARQCNYGSCVTLIAAEAGLGIRIMLPFRIGHPPLLIPWNDIHFSTEKSWWWTYGVMRFARHPDVPVRLGLKLMQGIQNARPGTRGPNMHGSLLPA